MAARENVMDGLKWPEPEDRPTRRSERVDKACDRFEAACGQVRHRGSRTTLPRRRRRTAQLSSASWCCWSKSYAGGAASGQTPRSTSTGSRHTPGSSSAPLTRRSTRATRRLKPGERQRDSLLFGDLALHNDSKEFRSDRPDIVREPQPHPTIWKR